MCMIIRIRQIHGKVKLNGNHLFTSAFKIGAKLFNVKIKITTKIKLGFVRKSYLYYVNIH